MSKRAAFHPAKFSANIHSEQSTFVETKHAAICTTQQQAQHSAVDVAEYAAIL